MRAPRKKHMARSILMISFFGLRHMDMKVCPFSSQGTYAFNASVEAQTYASASLHAACEVSFAMNGCCLAICLASRSVVPDHEIVQTIEAFVIDLRITELLPEMF